MRKVRNIRATVHQSGSKARIPVLGHSCWKLQRSPTNGRPRVSSRGRRRMTLTLWKALSFSACDSKTQRTESPGGFRYDTRVPK